MCFLSFHKINSLMLLHTGLVDSGLLYGANIVKCVYYSKTNSNEDNLLLNSIQCLIATDMRHHWINTLQHFTAL